MKVVSTPCCSFALWLEQCLLLALVWNYTEKTPGCLGDKELSDPKTFRSKCCSIPALGCLTMLLRGASPCCWHYRAEDTFPCQNKAGTANVKDVKGHLFFTVPAVQRRWSWSSGSIFRSGFVQTSLPLVKVASNNRFQIRKQLFFCLILIIGYFRFV